MKRLFAIPVCILTVVVAGVPARALTRPVLVDTGYGNASYGFTLQILGDDGCVKSERDIGGVLKISGHPGERYAIRIYNPLPVRAAVNLTVDGVNTIDGKPCGITDGARWMIEPMSWITIRGWQVNGAEARRFFFTDARKSYAAWRGARLHADLAANCGVIGAAFFWNRGELARWEREWRERVDAPELSVRRALAAEASGASCDLAPAAVPERKAGTGMGERETHLVRSIAFNADAGMLSADEALVLYYGFEEPSRPNPFPALTYAPERP